MYSKENIPPAFYIQIADPGITSLPVPVNQGGTGSATGNVSGLDFSTPPRIGKTTPAEGWLSPSVAKGPAIITTFAGTVTAAASTTVTFSSAADAILAGYSATNPVLGATLISNALTRYIVSWTNATTAVVDSSVTWAGTAITSVQCPIALFVDSSGTQTGYMTADGNVYFYKNSSSTLNTGQIILRNAADQVVALYGSTAYGGRLKALSDGRFCIYAYGAGAYVNILLGMDGASIANGNLGIYNATLGTSANRVIGLGEGTAPSDSPANATQLWSADKASIAAKNALHMRDEAGNNGPVAFANKLVVTHSGSEAATADQMYGSEHIVTGAYTVTLPAAVVGMSAKFTATTAAVMTLDSNASDQFILGGTALTAGYSIDSDGSAYAMCEVVCLTANKWVVRNTNVVWIDGGAS